MHACMKACMRDRHTHDPATQPACCCSLRMHFRHICGTRACPSRPFVQAHCSVPHTRTHIRPHAPQGDSARPHSHVMRCQSGCRPHHQPCQADRQHGGHDLAVLLLNADVDAQCRQHHQQHGVDLEQRHVRIALQRQAHPAGGRAGGRGGAGRQAGRCRMGMHMAVGGWMGRRQELGHGGLDAWMDERRPLLLGKMHARHLHPYLVAAPFSRKSTPSLL